MLLLSHEIELAQPYEQVRDGEELLKKYNLKANDAILAEDSHAPMSEIYVVLPSMTQLILALR